MDSVFFIARRDGRSLPWHAIEYIIAEIAARRESEVIKWGSRRLLLIIYYWTMTLCSK